MNKPLILQPRAAPLLDNETAEHNPMPPFVTRGLRADRVDSHLVMNVLNQMAAQDFKNKGEEDPLLFALSDYLREAFQHIDAAWVNLNHESKLLDSHLKLLAAVNGSEIRLTVDLHLHSLVSVPHSCLARIAACFMKAASPRPGGSWRMYVAVGGDTAVDGDVSLTVEVRSLAYPHVLHETDAREGVEKLCNEMPNPLVLRSARWSQDQPGHLRLVCSIPGLACGEL